MKNLFPLLILIIFYCSCSVNKNIPEVTPNIHVEKMHEISIDRTVSSIMKSDSNILLVDLTGNIYSFDQEKRNLNTLLRADDKSKKHIFIQNGIIAVRSVKNREIYVYDPAQSKILSKLKDISVNRIIGLNKENLIFLDNNSLKIIDLKNNTIKFSTNNDHGKIINCEIINGRPFILSERSLLIYDPGKNLISEIKINSTPVSPFLKINDHIYYGDSERNLVKFSINKKKIIWKLKFQKQLLTKPLSYKEMVITAPEDNNIYFITKRGGIKDWYRSDISHIFAPVLLKDHLAVFNLSEEGISIYYLGINKHSILKIKDSSLKLKLPPLYIDGSLYSVVSEKKLSELKLVKITNRFGIDIKTDPAGNFETGKSVKFQLKPVNILKPEITVEIYNPKKKSGFHKHILSYQSSSFAWIPGSEGSFTLNVLTIDRKGIQRTEVKELFVSNPGKIYKALQLKIHRKCENDEQTIKLNEEKQDKELSYK